MCNLIYEFKLKPTQEKSNTFEQWLVSRSRCTENKSNPSKQRNREGREELSERTHSCSNCGYTVDRDIAAAQVVRERGLAAVGHTVKMLAEGKFMEIPVKQESS